MMYKIELHLHTKQVSMCSCLYAKELAEGYHKAGYDAVVVTDHYNCDTWDYLGINPRTASNVLPQFLHGYQCMKEACAPYGIRVYLGAELRFYENENDYLFYGFAPDFLRQPHEIMDLGIVAFSQLVRPDKGVLIQAHPFRKTCVPVTSMLLDGIEVWNGTPCHMHHNHNDLALDYANWAGEDFIRTAGSDCHRTEDIGRGGILSETLPADSRELAQLLRSGRYQLITTED